MKKIWLLILGLLIIGIVGNVSAKTVQIYFYTNGATSSSNNVSITDKYVVLKETNEYYTTYKDTDIITSINSIRGKKFTISKTGNRLVSNKEWYCYDKNNTRYYFSQSKKYRVSDIVKFAGKEQDAVPMIDMYANWESKQQISVKSISMQEKNVTISKGSTKKIVVIFNPTNATNKNINWSSSNKKIATIDKSGNVKGIKAGTVTITAKSNNGKKTTCKVTVTKQAVAKTKWGITESEIKEIESGKRAITYELFGAVANDGKDDFSAIWRAHQFANYEYIEYGRYLTVYSCESKDCSNKNYVIQKQTCPISEYCKKRETSILVGTNTDLRNATIKLDDGAKGVDATQYTYKIGTSIGLHASIKQDGTGLIFLNNDMVNYLSNTKIINPSTTNLKVIIDAVYSNNIVIRDDSTQVVSQAQKQRLLNASKWGISVVNDNKVYNRKGVNTGSHNQVDDIIINSKTGEVLTPIDWTNQRINRIAIYPIDDTKRVFKNGKFISYTNNKVYASKEKEKANNRGILVQYSGNVEIHKITHSLVENKYPYRSKYQDNPNGNRYYGFITLMHASQVKLQSLKLTPHSRVKIYGTASNHEGTYDLIIDNSNNIVVNDVIHNCKSGDSACYRDRILNGSKWGIMGMNSSKNVWFTNCRLNRIDAHRGITNLYIENTTIGVHGFTLTGQGNFYAKNIKIDGGQRIMTLREDYGSTWNGTAVFNGVQFNVSSNTSEAVFVNAHNEENHDFGYRTYFPNLYMHNITIDTKSKKSNAKRISILDLSDTSKAKKESANKLYYFKGNISVTNIKFNNCNSQPTVYLFTDRFNNNKKNYLMSSYGGGNQVTITTSTKIKTNSNFNSSNKFKKTNNSTVNNQISTMETFFSNLRSKAGI